MRPGGGRARRGDHQRLRLLLRVSQSVSTPMAAIASAVPSARLITA
jgi:hypothetical protein